MAWTTGRGCDINRYDVQTGRETLVDGASTGPASEVLRSVWGDQIAFARVYERRSGDRGTYPYLYVRPLDGARSERQPGGSRGETGLPGPTRPDLYGRRLSFVRNYATDTRPARGRTEPWLDTVGGSHRLLSGASCNFTNGIYATYLSPTGSAGRIYYGFQRVTTGTHPPERSRTDVLLRYRISTGERSLAPWPARAGSHHSSGAWPPTATRPSLAAPTATARARPPSCALRASTTDEGGRVPNRSRSCGVGRSGEMRGGRAGCRSSDCCEGSGGLR